MRTVVPHDDPAMTAVRDDIGYALSLHAASTDRRSCEPVALSRSEVDRGQDWTSDAPGERRQRPRLAEKPPSQRPQGNSKPPHRSQSFRNFSSRKSILKIRLNNETQIIRKRGDIFRYFSEIYRHYLEIVNFISHSRFGRPSPRWTIR